MTQELRRAVVSYRDLTLKIRVSKDRSDLPNGYVAVELFKVEDDDSERILFRTEFREDDAK